MLRVWEIHQANGGSLNYSNYLFQFRIFIFLKNKTSKIWHSLTIPKEIPCLHDKISLAFTEYVVIWPSREYLQ